MNVFFQAGDAGDVKDVGVGAGYLGTPAHTMRTAYGEECSIAVSTRTADHHSEPHTHDQEQLNYIVEGEMWFYIVDKAYHVKKGDILRIPRNEVHWSWVKTNAPCVCIELFSPPMSNGQPLFESTDTQNVRQSAASTDVDLASLGLDLAEVESRPPVNR